MRMGLSSCPTWHTLVVLLQLELFRLLLNTVILSPQLHTRPFEDAEQELSFIEKVRFYILLLHLPYIYKANVLTLFKCMTLDLIIEMFVHFVVWIEVQGNPLKKAGNLEMGISGCHYCLTLRSFCVPFAQEIVPV